MALCTNDAVPHALRAQYFGDVIEENCGYCARTHKDSRERRMHVRDGAERRARERSDRMRGFVFAAVSLTPAPLPEGEGKMEVRDI
jgi:hypothetical protein